MELGFEAREFACVVAGVLFDAGLDGGRNCVAAEGVEGEGEMGLVSEAEELGPFGFGEGAEGGWVALREAERIEDCAEGTVHCEAETSWFRRETAGARPR